MAVIMFLTVSSEFSILEGSLLFLMACRHLSQEEFGAMWFMVNTQGALLCTASKVSLHLLSTFPHKMERHSSKELWKDINRGLLIMHKGALFASKDDRTKCQE